MKNFRRLAALPLLVCCQVAAAGAQDVLPPRVSAETVASGTMFSSYKHVSAMFDATVSVDAGRGLTAIARPWWWRRPDGTSTFQWYQLQLRYETRAPRPIRVDAGVIASPLGLGTLQSRSDLNPTIAPIAYYVVPLPRLEPTFDGLQMMSAGYPLGVVVTSSGPRWDLRGGVTDSTPARSRAELKSGQRPPMPQIVLGGGFTPRAGLRLGAGFAHGRYRNAGPDAPAAAATVFNVEGEYAFGHTRLSGEWVLDRFDTIPNPSEGRSFYLQGVQTLTPRLFAAARVVHTRTPPIIFGTLRPTTDWTTAEVTGGLRLSRDWTARGGYNAQRTYLATAWDNQAAVSLVWAKRWR